MKPFIVIAGMHRSGTAFLARALNLSGVYLGSLESLTLTELNADQSNPRGHWESREFIKLGIETREFNKLNYQKIPEKIKISEKIGNELKNAVEGLVKHPSIAGGFKDPHTLLYLNEWMEFFPKNTIIISIFRHPLKVAESLKIRDGRGYEESIRIWKAHNRGLIRALEKHEGFVLDFDWPKEKLFEEINFIRDKVGLLQVDLSDWYTEDLKRSDKTFEEEYTIDDELETLYKKLKDFSTKNKLVTVEKHNPTSKELTEILTTFYDETKKQMNYFKKQIEETKQKANEYEKINENKINLISLLLAVYYKRPKLKEKFPEVHQGNFNKIIEWAAMGDYKDVKLGEDIEIIRKNIEFFKTELKKQQSDESKTDYQIDHLREELKKCRNELARIHKSPPWKILKKIGRV